MTSANTAPRLSIKQQAEYVDVLIERCWSHGVDGYQPVALFLKPEDVEVLRELAVRLRRMAPHENDIRRIVVGR